MKSFTALAAFAPLAAAFALSLLLPAVCSAAIMYSVTDLGTFGGQSWGYGINSSGQVTGDSTTAAGGDFRAFLYDGVMHDLGTLGVWGSWGFGINDTGQVTGTTSTTYEYHAFLYDGVMHDLGTLGGTHSEGTGINASGHVVGGSYTTGTTNYHAFLYDGAMHDLGTLGGTSSGGAGINASGQVVGSSYTTGTTNYHAFLYYGAMHDLGTLGGEWSGGNAINASGQVVGSSDGWAFLYDSAHGMVNLNSLIDPASGWDFLLGASGINDVGQITGTGEIGGDLHAFLLTPVSVPEPSTLVLAALGFAGLLAQAWRRKK